MSSRICCRRLRLAGMCHRMSTVTVQLHLRRHVHPAIIQRWRVLVRADAAPRRRGPQWRTPQWRTTPAARAPRWRAMPRHHRWSGRGCRRTSWSRAMVATTHGQVGMSSAAMRTEARASSRASDPCSSRSPDSSGIERAAGNTKAKANRSFRLGRGSSWPSWCSGRHVAAGRRW